MKEQAYDYYWQILYGFNEGWLTFDEAVELGTRLYKAVPWDETEGFKWFKTSLIEIKLRKLNEREIRKAEYEERKWKIQQQHRKMLNESKD